MANVRRGAIVQGTVVLVEDNSAVVSVGAKQDGRIYLDHYTSDKNVKSLKELVKEGDSIQAMISEVKESVILLSRLEIEEKEKRDKVVRKIMRRHPFTATVKKSVENGLILDLDGVNLLLPNNYVDLDSNFDKTTLVGQEVKVMFVKSEQDEKGRTTFVVTRKQLQYNELKHNKEQEFASINVDDVLEGEVVRLADFGAFVKFNLIEGMIHLTEISHYHIKSPAEMLEVGQKVTVKVIKKTDTKIQLSIKALEKSPWEKFLEAHKVGDTVETKIVKKGESWMLCEIERDVVGILNKDDYSWNPEDNLAGQVEEGDSLTLQITYIDKDKQKMTLSKKHLEYNPWQDVHMKSGDIVTGSVLRFTTTGAIVKVGNVEGFLSNRDASDTGKDAKDVLKEGEVVSCEVLKVNPRNWYLSLSIRSIEEKKNREFVDKYLEENESASSSLADLFSDVETE